MKRISVYRVGLIREGSYTVSDARISSPRDAAMIFRLYFEEYCGYMPDREVFLIAALSTKNKVCCISPISEGSLNSAIVHPREVFKTAILHNAASIICCHNHPSGDASPSLEDIEVTERLMKAGDILGIEVLDQVILGENDQYVSLKEKGLV